VTAISPHASGLGSRHEAALRSGRLEYYEAGSGEPIVLLHGLALSATFWRKVVPGLTDRYRCITPTLPLGGHRSAMAADADLTPPAVADLVVELLDAIGVDQAVVVGNDTGGAIAQLVVARHPDRVRALVLTPCDAFDHFLPWKFKHLQALARVPGGAWQTSRLVQLAWFRRSPLALGLLSKYGVPDDVSAEWVRTLRDDAGVRRDLVKVLRGISTRHTRAAAEALPQFDGPALVLWAREDRVFPTADGERLASLLPRGRYDALDDTHTYIPEDQPDALVTELLKFADEVDGAASDPRR
jgi:pimeloyl-ACP methyl ester carboxylesterase